MGRKFDENEKVFLKKVGKVLKKCRKDKTQVEISKEIGISANDISRYERGEKDISLLTLRKFCNYYKVNMSSFLYNVQTPPKTKINDELDSLRNSIETFSSNAYKIIRNIKNLE